MPYSFFRTGSRTMAMLIRQSLTQRRVLPAIILAAGAFFAPDSSFAEFILDDFDDPADVVSPAMENVEVVTNDVGDLSAQRVLRIASIQADPLARIDSALTSPSKLTMQLVSLNPTGSLPDVDAQFGYNDLGHFDFTENGRNDALFLDVDSVKGPTPPDFVRILVFNDLTSLSFFSTFETVPESNTPFTAVFPFSSFRRRDGVPELADFEHINRVHVSVFANGFFNNVEELGWTVEIGRFWVGSIVPEPSSIVELATASVLGSLWFLYRKKRPWKGVRHETGEFRQMLGSSFG